MWCIAFILASAPLLGEAQNLLANPGFEELVVDRPARWDCFVLPQPGAVGRLSDVSHGGRYGVMLHVPMPYEEEPVNNWSQNIIAELGGKRLRLAGFVRSQEAGEAALWLQCWRKRPLRVTKIVSTSTDHPVYGTRDWEGVEATVDVPEGCDFVTLRCVLKGVGTAWFDDVSVEIVEKPADEEEEAPPKAKPVVSGDAPPKLLVPDDIARFETEISRLKDANMALAEALERIQDSNDKLREQLFELRRDISGLRNELKETPAGESRREAP